jgi:hypothetical protein
MKMILDLDHIISEMGLSQESFAQWKAANLEDVAAGGSASWSVLEEAGFLNKAYHKAADLKIG